MAMEIIFHIKTLITLSVVCLIFLLIYLCSVFVFKPQKLRDELKKQGVSGPPPTLLLGNIREMKKLKDVVHVADDQPLVTHNCAAFTFPFLELCRKQYGKVFVFSLGNLQILGVSEAEMVKDITTCTSLSFGKPSYQQKVMGPLLGEGILTSNGTLWSHQRKILAPQLYMDKVKEMVKLINVSANIMVKSWKSRVSESEGETADIKIDEEMRSFSGDVISRACFGSNYSKGENIFVKLRSLQEAMSRRSLASGIPGIRILPTKSNREASKLEKEIRNLIIEAVKERREAACEQDLLQMVIEGADSSSLGRDATNRFIVDNCKNIYLAGYETTAVSATWTLMLLAANPPWQDRIRREVLHICGGHLPDAEMLRKMKQLNMVINESLRLYPPVAVVSREALKDMKLGHITVPKGMYIWTLVLPLHTDPENWGPDSYKFNPDRFSNGISGACKNPSMYMPFGVGPRVCLGQNLAMVELKVLIALLLSNFSFSISPNYIHSPAVKLVVEPEYGVNLLVKKL